jgi:4a-hydroxytetrahydrobiopterin dehydratase
MSEPALGRGLLDAAAVAERLQGLAGWTLEDGKLRKSYTFPNFEAAVGFVDRLTVVAEAHNHHPDLFVGWGKVIVHLWSMTSEALHRAIFGSRRLMTNSELRNHAGSQPLESGLVVHAPKATATQQAVNTSPFGAMRSRSQRLRDAMFARVLTPKIAANTQMAIRTEVDAPARPKSPSRASTT